MGTSSGSALTISSSMSARMACPSCGGLLTPTGAVQQGASGHLSADYSVSGAQAELVATADIRPEGPLDIFGAKDAVNRI